MSTTPNENPYAVSNTSEELELAQTFDVPNNAEAIRKAHLNLESNLKSVGSLYILGGGICAVAGAFLLFTGMSGNTNPEFGDPDALPPAVNAAINALLIALGIFQLFVGIGLTRFRPWSRIAGAVLAGIGLLNFPFGTLINALILWGLLCKRGAYIFTDEYRQIMQETPHIRYRTSIILWILLGLLIAILFFAFFMAIAVR